MKYKQEFLGQQLGKGRREAIPEGIAKCVGEKVSTIVEMANRKFT